MENTNVDNSQLDELRETAISEGLEINTSEQMMSRGENAALDFLQLPQVKATVNFLRQKIHTIHSRRDITPFMKKLMLKPVAGDYKTLELMTREMFAIFQHLQADPDNIQIKADLNFVIEKITDLVYECIIKHEIEVPGVTDAVVEDSGNATATAEQTEAAPT